MVCEVEHCLERKVEGCVGWNTVEDNRNWTNNESLCQSLQKCIFRTHFSVKNFYFRGQGDCSILKSGIMIMIINENQPMKAWLHQKECTK